jgi:hypothetical protein
MMITIRLPPCDFSFPFCFCLCLFYVTYWNHMPLKKVGRGRRQEKGGKERRRERDEWKRWF